MSELFNLLTQQNLSARQREMLRVRLLQLERQAVSGSRAAIELLVSQVVDLNTTTKTSLYTAPLNKVCVVQWLVVRNASISLTTAVGGAGYNANADDVVTPAALSALTGSTLYLRMAPKSGAKVGAAGDVFGFRCSTAQGAAATATVEVYGSVL